MSACLWRLSPVPLRIPTDVVSSQAAASRRDEQGILLRTTAILRLADHHLRTLFHLFLPSSSAEFFVVSQAVESYCATCFGRRALLSHDHNNNNHVPLLTLLMNGDVQVVSEMWVQKVGRSSVVFRHQLYLMPTKSGVEGDLYRSPIEPKTVLGKLERIYARRIRPSHPGEPSKPLPVQDWERESWRWGGRQGGEDQKLPFVNRDIKPLTSIPTKRANLPIWIIPLGVVGPQHCNESHHVDHAALADFCWQGVFMALFHAGGDQNAAQLQLDMMSGMNDLEWMCKSCTFDYLQSPHLGVELECVVQDHDDADGRKSTIGGHEAIFRAWVTSKSTTSPYIAAVFRLDRILTLKRRSRL